MRKASLLLVLALASSFMLDAAEAGSKSPPPNRQRSPPSPMSLAEIKFECIVIFYTGLDFMDDSFGFSTGEVIWDGVSPLFFTLWDFSKIEVGFVADDRIRSLEFKCDVGEQELYSLEELQKIIELRLYAWPFRKENGGIHVNIADYPNGGIVCSKDDDGVTTCSRNLRELPGMDRKASAAAITMNFLDFDPSQGKRPPPPPTPPEPPAPPSPPNPPPPPPPISPPPYVLKHKPGYRQRPARLHSPRPPRPPPPFRPPPPYRTPPPAPPTSPRQPDTPYFPLFPASPSPPSLILPPYLPYTPYAPPTADSPPPVYGSPVDTKPPTNESPVDTTPPYLPYEPYFPPGTYEQYPPPGTPALDSPPGRTDDGSGNGQGGGQGDEDVEPPSEPLSPYLPYMPYSPPEGK